MYLLGSEGSVLSELTLFAFSWTRVILSGLTPFAFSWTRVRSLVRAHTFCIFLDQSKQSCQSSHYLHFLGPDGAALSKLTLFAFPWTIVCSLVRAYTICISWTRVSSLVRAHTIFIFLDQSDLVRAYTFCIYLDQSEQSCQSSHYLHLLGPE